MTPPELESPRRLIFRLSSIGDVVLTAAVLRPDLPDESVDWVISAEFAGLLRGHPKISRLWEFDRKIGLLGWVSLCRKLWETQYDEVFDLHSTLRTRIARLLFWYWAWRDSRQSRSSERDAAGVGVAVCRPVWHKVSKQRWKSYGYFSFKGIWPKALRPRPWTERFARCFGGTGGERPDLGFLLKTAAAQSKCGSGIEGLLASGEAYVCVMPGSRWQGKRWPVGHYVALFTALSQVEGGKSPIPVVMGTPSDRESVALAAALSGRSIRHVSAVGKFSFAQVARILSGAQAFLGSDTGLAHLAEAVGTPAWMILGPTVEDMGFGPWRRESGTIGSDLWCRPCGKDGRACFRVRDRYACMKRLTPSQVMRKLRASGIPALRAPGSALENRS